MDQNRRRLLISLGYGAVSVATLGALGVGRDPSVVPRSGPSDTPPPGLAATEEVSVAGTTQVRAESLVPPVLDASLQ
ncbi:MAG: hypothetical protein ACR2NL_11795, partial [Acidimicrobiia bacterium]